MCTVDAMIPVWNPDWRLRECVRRVLSQSLRVRKLTLILSIDGTWDESSVEEWFPERDRIEIIKIRKEMYNHGGTRHRWAEEGDADYLLFLVQDAVPEDDTLVERMIGSIRNQENAVVYARQIPGLGCNEIEAFTRYFNYPPYSLKKTKIRLLRGGVKDCFTSNVCAAYRRDWYEKTGGFEQHILLSEDSVYAAKVMKAGANVIYNADAHVIHAHDFGYRIQWKRNFDIGVVHKKYDDIFGGFSSEREGIRLVKETAAYLIRKRRLLLLPELFLLSSVKFLAYQAGKHYDRLPEKLIEKWSWDKYYWKEKRNEGK